MEDGVNVVLVLNSCAIFNTSMLLKYKGYKKISGRPNASINPNTINLVAASRNAFW